MAWKRALLIAASTLIAIGVLGFYWKIIRTTQGPGAGAAAQAAPTRHLDAPQITFVDPSIGPKDAKFVIVEFGDYLCPFCRDSGQAIDQLLAKHPADVRFVWKHDPSPLHPGADRIAEAAMCAGKQGAFWTYHKRMLESQDTYNDTALALAAGDLGLDTGKFTDCLVKDETKPLIDRTVAEGQALGVTGLPTFFINGKRYEGATTYDQLEQALIAK
jgi:protein-disulfide isomerase